MVASWLRKFTLVTTRMVVGCQKLIKTDISDISFNGELLCYDLQLYTLFILFLNCFVKCIHHECPTMNEPKAPHDSQIRVAEAGESAVLPNARARIAIKPRNCEPCW